VFKRRPRWGVMILSLANVEVALATFRRKIHLSGLDVDGQ